MSTVPMSTRLNASVALSVSVITENIEVEDAQLVLEVTLTGATFESGEATVSIPFAEEVPAGKLVKVYYIDGEGNRTDMNATFENGKIFKEIGDVTLLR